MKRKKRKSKNSKRIPQAVELSRSVRKPPMPRPTTFKSKDMYDRKDKSWQKEEE